eukprot:3581259-Lingulodinium_polyedra.AAC.1
MQVVLRHATPTRRPANGPPGNCGEAQPRKYTRHTVVVLGARTHADLKRTPNLRIGRPTI